MASVFQLMTPVRTMTKYNLDLLDVVEDDKKLLNFLRMEKWLADRPHHPGAAARQWLIELYKENRLVKGTFELGGEAVDLKKAHDAGPEHLRPARPHHSSTLLDGAWCASRHTGLHRAAVAGRTRRGLRQLEEPRHRRRYRV